MSVLLSTHIYFCCMYTPQLLPGLKNYLSAQLVPVTYWAEKARLAKEYREGSLLQVDRVK
jgi:hypothetical protein